jgi:hypothetical protein
LNFIDLSYLQSCNIEHKGTLSADFFYIEKDSHEKIPLYYVNSIYSTFYLEWMAGYGNSWPITILGSLFNIIKWHHYSLIYVYNIMYLSL